jgi:hypothetical protein
MAPNGPESVANLTTLLKSAAESKTARCVRTKKMVSTEIRHFVLGASTDVLCWRILEVTMKKIALAAALSMAATTAFAGGHTSKMKEPVVEPLVVVEDVKSSSSAGVIVPLMLLLVVAAAAASR